MTGTNSTTGADDAAELGRLVARGLPSAIRLPPGVGVVDEIRLDRMRVELAAVPGESTRELAGRIIDQIAARLGHGAAEEAVR